MVLAGWRSLSGCWKRLQRSEKLWENYLPVFSTIWLESIFGSMVARKIEALTEFPETLYFQELDPSKAFFFFFFFPWSGRNSDSRCWEESTVGCVSPTCSPMCSPCVFGLLYLFLLCLRSRNNHEVVWSTPPPTMWRDNLNKKQQIPSEARGRRRRQATAQSADPHVKTRGKQKPEIFELKTWLPVTSQQVTCTRSSDLCTRWSFSWRKFKERLWVSQIDNQMLLLPGPRCTCYFCLDFLPSWFSPSRPTFRRSFAQLPPSAGWEASRGGRGSKS